MYYQFDRKSFFNYLLKEYLNPTLKRQGYKKSSNNWTKKTEETIITISLQKSRDNTAQSIAFCFNISIRSISDSTISISSRQEFFLTRERESFKKDNYGSRGWYVIFRENECEKLEEEIRIDLEEFILPVLEEIGTDDKLLNIIQKAEILLKTERPADVYYIRNTFK